MQTSRICPEIRDFWGNVPNFVPKIKKIIYITNFLKLCPEYIPIFSDVSRICPDFLVKCPNFSPKFQKIPQKFFILVILS